MRFSFLLYSSLFSLFWTVAVFHLFPADRVHVLEDRSLVLENVDSSDEGEYRCEADNLVGSVSAVGSLVIHCKFSKQSVTLS